MVYSEILQETIFFAEDEVSKAALVEAGASEWNKNTKDELRVLVANNRVKLFIPRRTLHASRDTKNLPREDYQIIRTPLLG
jgi:hypothetical protein